MEKVIGDGRGGYYGWVDVKEEYGVGEFDGGGEEEVGFGVVDELLEEGVD